MAEQATEWMIAQMIDCWKTQLSVPRFRDLGGRYCGFAVSHQMYLAPNKGSAVSSGLSKPSPNQPQRWPVVSLRGGDPKLLSLVT